MASLRANVERMVDSWYREGRVDRLEMIRDITIFCELWIERAIRASTESSAAPEGPQIACDHCSQGVMDLDNPHLRGSCSCECHRDPDLIATALIRANGALFRGSLLSDRIEAFRAQIARFLREAPIPAHARGRAGAAPAPTKETQT